jgi:iron only hydrogenase large subunit-like protein
MMGALIKSHFAERSGILPERIVSVSIMPCTAKKAERSRPEHGRGYRSDVDYVLTTREVAELLRRTGIDLRALEPEAADSPFGERTGAGKLFGASGGVMEAALRTAHFMLTGAELPSPKIEPLRAGQGMRQVRVRIGDREVGAAVVSGLGNARRLLAELRAGRSDLHFIEVMSCEGGCVAGGGQPLGSSLERVRARTAALYAIDEHAPVRQSHHNPDVARLYAEFLGEPLGEKSHELLHTHYHPAAL